MIDKIIYIAAILLVVFLVILPIYYVMHMGNPKRLLSNILYAIAILGYVVCGLAGLFLFILIPLMSSKTLTSASTLIHGLVLYIACYILIAIAKRIDKNTG